jgi:hypothetical protein
MTGSPFGLKIIAIFGDGLAIGITTAWSRTNLRT